MFDVFLHQPALIIPALALLIPIVAIIAHHWQQVRRAELERRLKEQMLERGMSAEDIERVLAAGSLTPDHQSAPCDGAKAR